MKGYAKRIVPLFLAAAVTGCLCMGVTALAQEAGEGTAGEAMELREEQQEELQEEQQGQASAPQNDGISVQAASGTCGENLTWELDEAEGTLTIRGTGDMADYNYEGQGDGLEAAPWFAQQESIKKVVLEDGVTSIGKSAFANCQSLTSIEIPDSVTAIGGSAFFCCRGLSSIEIPCAVPSIRTSTFFYCTALESVTFHDGLKTLGWNSFHGCYLLKNVTLPDGLETIGIQAFSECAGLTSITIPDSVRTISERAFYECPELMEITIPKSVTLMGDHAYGYALFFKKYPNAVIKCYTDSTAHEYAKKFEVRYELLDGGGSKNPGTGDQTVKPVKVSKITISGISTKIAAGKKIKLTAKVSPANAANQAVKWTSSNKKLATVNSSGVVTIKSKAAGKTVTITAAAKDGSKVKKTYKIKVMKDAVKSVAISGKKTRTVKAGKTLKLTAKVKASKSANKKLKWTSGNKKYASVSASGKVSAKKAGKGKKVKITAAATDGSNKKASVTIKIK